MTQRSPLTAAAALLAVVAVSTFSLPAAAQDAEAGQKVFNQCRACHKLDQSGTNAVGPNLWGVTKRNAGVIENFKYSASMKEKAAAGLTWTDEESLKAYLANPKAVVEKGAMSFPGLKNPQQILDVIAYLKANGGGA